jgi:hypothetical protein
MATQKIIAGSGVGLTWTTCFGAEINSLVNGNAVLSSVNIDNSTALDLLADISVSLGSITPGAGNPYIGFFLYPLNQDGSTYGDGRFTSSAPGPVPSSYWEGNIPCIPSTTGVVTGSIIGITLIPGAFKLLMLNASGTTLAASANTVKYRTYNYSVA